MKKNIIFIFLLAFVNTFCQEETKALTPSFSVISSGGIVKGERNVSSFFQVIPGIHYKKFFMGTGLGLDDYRFRSIPLVADLRYDFGKKNGSFLYSDIGYNLPFDIQKQKTLFKTKDVYKGGFYGDFGAGFRLLKKGKHAFLFSAGYSIKCIGNTVEYTYGSIPSPPEDIFHYRYSMGRIVLKLSWEFGRK